MLAWLNPEHWTWLNPEHWWPDNPPLAPTWVNPSTSWEDGERHRVRMLLSGTSASAVQRIRTDAAHLRAPLQAPPVNLSGTGIRWVKRSPTSGATHEDATGL